MYTVDLVVEINDLVVSRPEEFTKDNHTEELYATLQLFTSDGIAGRDSLAIDMGEKKNAIWMLWHYTDTVSQDPCTPTN